MLDIMKKISISFIAVFILTLAFSMTGFALSDLENYDYSKFNSQQRVYSFGDFLSSETMTKFNKMSKEIEQKTGVVVPFIITNDFDGDVEEFSDRIYLESQLGLSYNENIIMLVVDMNGRRVDLYTHGKGQLSSSDEWVDDILNNTIVPDLKSEDYEKLISNFYGKTYDNLRFYVKDKEYIIGRSIFFGLIAGAIITLLLVGFNLLKHFNIKKAVHANEYTDSESFILQTSDDVLIGTNTTAKPIPKNTGSGSGGGGGSSHSHSSGFSHGGGSRSF
jgi:uncharacterized protein